MAGRLVLVVDDEPDLRELLRYNLQREGFEVITTADGEAALALAAKHEPDLIVLDLMLPGIDGIEVCRRIRQDKTIASTPVIMLTAKTDETDEVIGLGVGADDFVTKPFSPRVLVARIRAALRRDKINGEDTDEAPIVHGELSIDTIGHEVTLAGNKLKLTPLEFKILYALARNPGKVFSRSQIIEKALGDDIHITERTVDVHLVSLRKKLGESAALIQTVRGVGYKFVA